MRSSVRKSVIPKEYVQSRPHSGVFLRNDATIWACGSERRLNKKDLVTDYLSLSINEFRRRGQWKYWSGTLTWWRGEVKRGSIGYSVQGDKFVLQWQDQNQNAHEERVSLEQVRVKYGERYYFRCPACGRRVIKLYAGSYFYCRKCYNLTYESCRESHSPWHKRLGLSDKQYRNFFKTVEYARELQKKKWVGKRMLRRLKRYEEKSNVIFGHSGR